jgi:DNA-binding response OmpR family regulator
MPQIVLVVDDDSSIAHTLRSILLKSGFEVITATDGEEALKMIKTNKPDLIITDLVMPVMDGWYFKMKVREDKRLKTTPIIILSGLLVTEAGQLEHEAATFYVPKPFNTSMLMEKIKDLLKG